MLFLFIIPIIIYAANVQKICIIYANNGKNQPNNDTPVIIVDNETPVITKKSDEYWSFNNEKKFVAKTFKLVIDHTNL